MFFPTTLRYDPLAVEQSLYASIIDITPSLAAAIPSSRQRNQYMDFFGPLDFEECSDVVQAMAEMVMDRGMFEACSLSAFMQTQDAYCFEMGSVDFGHRKTLYYDIMRKYNHDQVASYANLFKISTYSDVGLTVQMAHDALARGKVDYYGLRAAVRGVHDITSPSDFEKSAFLYFSTQTRGFITDKPSYIGHKWFHIDEMIHRDLSLRWSNLTSTEEVPPPLEEVIQETKMEQKVPISISSSEAKQAFCEC